MKIYEKPMAIIEKINVEDVITASDVTARLTNTAEAIKTQTGAEEVILFQW